MKNAIYGLAFASLLALPAYADERLSYDMPTPDGLRTAIFIGDKAAKPTIIVLHGHFGTGELTARKTGFAEAAKAYGFNALFPDGLNRSWNDGREGEAAPDDVGYINALAQKLVADGLADPKRLYIAGISNGGMMSFRMMCEAKANFAGIGTIIANAPAQISTCPGPPVPLVMVNGTADPMVPFAGGNVGFRGKRGAVNSVAQTAQFFATRNHCGTASDFATPAGSSLPVIKTGFSGCAAPVTLYRVEGGGHQVPGGSGFLAGLLGPTAQNFSAAKAIIASFAAQKP